jgi:hypothetical protein
VEDEDPAAGRVLAHAMNADVAVGDVEDLLIGREHPELLAGLNFADVKGLVADELVARLSANEDRYQGATVELMLNVASM